MMKALVDLTLSGSRVLAETFASGLWQGPVLVAVLAVCLRTLRNTGASVRFSVFGVLFAFTVGLSLDHLVLGDGMSSPAPTIAPLQIRAFWSVPIAITWALMSSWRGIALLREGCRLHGVAKRATPMNVSDEVAVSLRTSGRSRQAALCVSAEVTAPCVIGFFSPRLLLPVGLGEVLSERELRQLVLHECEHLRRADDWSNLLQKLSLVLFPLNPALLWMDARMSLERELACDAGVVLATGEPIAYASCLARIAEHRLGYQGVALALAAWGRRSELAIRVYRLLQPRPSQERKQSSAALFTLSTVMLAGTIGMGRVPSLIQFGPSANPVREQMAVVTADDRPAPMAKSIRASYIVPTKRTYDTDTTNLPALAPAIKRRTHHVRPEFRLTTRRLARVEDAGEPAILRIAAGRPPRALAVNFLPHYAALPFGDGWLIVQI